MNITYDMLDYIWNRNERILHVAYTVIRDNGLIISPIDVLSDLQKRLKIGSNRFVEKLCDSELKLNYFPSFRRQFYHSINIIYDFIERYFLKNVDVDSKLGTDFMEEYRKHKDEYIDF